ncbi:hypothetical protein AN958_01249 [Leucoagaricus sp. SymC.cos]|nr:hypothetical protein AN958_01249 [Leucoagaricus sp. SymC.cos]
MLFVGRIRVVAVLSWIAVEEGWTGFLWIMWLATAGTTASVNHSGGKCGVGIRGFSTFCGEVNAVEAFAFLNWIMRTRFKPLYIRNIHSCIVLIYFVALLVFTIRSQQAGEARIWTTSVNEADFGGGSSYGYTHNKNNFLQPSSAPQYPPAQA